MKLKYVALFVLVLFLNATGAQNSGTLTIDDTCKSVNSYFSDKLTIAGDIYKVSRTLKILTPPSPYFCIDFVSEQPSTIWNLKTYLNGVEQSYALSENRAVILPNDIVQINKKLSKSTYGYSSENPFCFDLNKSTINTIDVNFLSTGKIKKAVHIPIIEVTIPTDFGDLAFPFDARIISQPPTSNGIDNWGDGLQYTGIFEYPSDYEPYALGNVTGRALSIKGVFLTRANGSSQLVANIVTNAPVSQEIKVFSSNTPSQASQVIIGPICATTTFMPVYVIGLKHSMFSLLLFGLAIILCTIVLLFYSNETKKHEGFSILLIILGIQEGISQLSPISRPLVITLFDLVVPSAIVLLFARTYYRKKNR